MSKEFRHVTAQLGGVASVSNDPKIEWPVKIIFSSLGTTRTAKTCAFWSSHFVSPCGPAVRRLAGKQKDLGSIGFGSPFSSLQKLWFTDTAM